MDPFNSCKKAKLTPHAAVGCLERALKASNDSSWETRSLGLFPLPCSLSRVLQLTNMRSQHISSPHHEDILHTHF